MLLKVRVWKEAYLLFIYIFFIGTVQQIVHRNAEKIGYTHKYFCWNIMSSRFIIAVRPLAYKQFLSYVCLGQIHVFTKISNPDVLHNIIPFADKYYFTVEQIILLTFRTKHAIL